MGRTGRPAKYEGAEDLKRAVDAYFASISYQEPAVVATPTGEVDESGRVIWKTKLLTEPPERPGGIGKPKTVTKWLSKPGLAGLCLSLGISRDTWWRYAKKTAFREVCEAARLRMEECWYNRLEGKDANGAKFVLENCFGWSGDWRERQEAGSGQEDSLALSVERFLKKAERGGADGDEY